MKWLQRWNKFNDAQYSRRQTKNRPPKGALMTGHVNRLIFGKNHLSISACLRQVPEIGNGQANGERTHHYPRTNHANVNANRKNEPCQCLAGTSIFSG
jgi:hypothetical protein